MNLSSVPKQGTALYQQIPWEYFEQVNSTTLPHR